MSDPTNIPCAAGPGYVHFNAENADRCVFCRSKPTLGKAPKNIALSDDEWSRLTPQGQIFIREAEAGGLRYLLREDDGVPYAWGGAHEGLFRRSDVVVEPHSIDGWIISLRYPHPVHPHQNSGGRFMLFTGPNADGKDYAAQIHVWKLSMHQDFGVDHPRTPFLVCTNHTWHITDRTAIAERDACLGIEHVTDAQLMEILALPVSTPCRLP